MKNNDAVADPYKGMSVGERRIAAMLDNLGIQYEYQLQNRKQIPYMQPEFFLPDSGLRIRYYDDYAYAQRNRYGSQRNVSSRIEKDSAHAVAMFPRYFTPGWEKHLLGRIDDLLEDRFNRFPELTDYNKHE